MMCLLFFGVSVPAHAQAWSGVLSPTRATDWSHAGIPGGIPSASWTQCGSTIAAYGSAGAPASPATIQTAVNGCGSNQYVQLGSGNFYLSGSIYVKGQSNVEIRGMGANSTFIYFYGNTGVAGDNCQGLYATICFESADQSGNMSPSNIANWTGGYSQGATVITLVSAPNLKIGNPIILDQLLSPTDNGAVLEQDVTTGGNSFTSPGSPGPYSGQGGEVRPGRGLTHVYTVTGCNGSTTIGTSCSGTNVAVTIDPPLEESYWNSGLSPQAWWASLPDRNVGLQNLSIDGTNNGCGAGNGFGVAFWNTVNVWQKGVRDINECRTHTMIQYTARATIRDSYMFLARYSTSTSYGFECFAASDSLIENNIIQAIAGGMTVQEGCNGLVLGYNFEINGYYANVGTVIPMSNMHGVASDLNLYEGNVGSKINTDGGHGSHNFDTMFRNRIAAVNPICWAGGPGSNDYAGYLATAWGPCTGSVTALELDSFSRFMNVLGNVLGSTGVTTSYQNTGVPIYYVGQGYTDGSTGVTVPNDPAVTQTMYRWGNCDSVNGFAAANCQFNSAEVPTTGTLATSQQPYAQSAPGSHSLPASFYYSSKPAWWPASKAWPIIGPDVTGGNISSTGGLAYTNPAQDCYLSLPGATSTGTGGPFPFDANTCYGGGSVTSQPVPPTNLTATVN
jgi:hypothetical protein